MGVIKEKVTQEVKSPNLRRNSEHCILSKSRKAGWVGFITEEEKVKSHTGGEVA